MDPEALLLFSLEVGRDDPRLFDELLDWMRTNERLVSVQRLRNLAVEAEDSLADAALSWVAQWKPRRRLNRRSSAEQTSSDLAPLFRRVGLPLSALDDAFAAHGYAKPPSEPSGKSQPPDMDAPINFAFRLRSLFGVSARAEVMRCLLTTDAPRVSTQVIARSAVYSKRNVQEALNSLRAAHAISSVLVGGEQSYRADRSSWDPLLRFGEDGWPLQKEWPQLLGALAGILRWLADHETRELSDYMLESHARDLLEDIAADLLYAGVQPEPIPPRAGRDALGRVATMARRAVSAFSET